MKFKLGENKMAKLEVLGFEVPAGFIADKIGPQLTIVLGGLILIVPAIIYYRLKEMRLR